MVTKRPTGLSDDGGLRIGFDPWARDELSPQGAKRPEEAVFLMKLGWLIECFAGEDSYYLHRPDENIAELWAESQTLCLKDKKASVVTRVRSMESDDCLLGRDLLYKLWVSKGGVMMPGELLAGGALSQGDWDAIEEKLLRLYGYVDWEDVPDPHGLLRLANELELSPSGKGTESPQCSCNCALGRSHPMDIDPVRGLWRCGYCGIGGGASELRKTVAGRRKKK
ncbi:MAG: hypothetical protein ACI9K5_004189 [Gammaproteobacteria bacterium]